jgi:hypothetical protein
LIDRGKPELFDADGDVIVDGIRDIVNLLGWK